AVELVLRQHRAAGLNEQRVEYDFPVGQVIECFARTFDSSKCRLGVGSLQVEFVVVRSDSKRGLRGPTLDRDGRENGMLIVDDRDAVYDLTFADLDYEKADFLSRIFGIVRVNGLREVLERYLEAEAPTSPLRTDRDGFNREHEFARALLDFISDNLKSVYEKERKRVEAEEQGEFSSETKKRIDDALRHLNKYFQRMTELSGDGSGTGEDETPEPEQSVVFFPQRTKLTVGHPRTVLLLVRDDIIKEGAEVLAAASESFIVQPEIERIHKKNCPRWKPHKHFFSLRFSVSSSETGKQGEVAAMVEGKDGDLIEARLQIEDVLA